MGGPGVFGDCGGGILMSRPYHEIRYTLPRPNCPGRGATGIYHWCWCWCPGHETQRREHGLNVIRCENLEREAKHCAERAALHEGG